jgi:hypothetical protein
MLRSRAVSYLIRRDSGGDLRVAGLANEPDTEVTEGGHNAGAGAGPDPGCVLTESDITDLLQGRSPAS